MKASGIDAISNKKETEEYIEFNVKIPKNQQTDNIIKLKAVNQA